MASFRSLSHNRDFTALWVGATVSELGFRVTAFAMPLAAYAMTGSALWAAVAEGVYLLGMVVVLLPAGVLADRCDRLRIMRLSLATGVVLYGSLVVAGVTGALSMGHLLGVALLTGLATGLFSPAEYSAIRSIVSREELPTALSQQQARQHVASLLGGPLGGALFSVARWAPFAADVATYAAGWLLLGRVRADLSPAPTEVPSRPVHDLREGLRFLWRHPFLRVMLVWSPGANLTINALFFVALLRLLEAGFPAWQIGLVEMAIGACGILGALVAPWLIDRFATGRMTVVIAWSFVPLSLPLAVWNDPWAMMLAASVGMLLNPAGNAGMAAYRMVITPPELVGRVQSAMQFTAMLTMPLAPALAGVLLSLVSGGVAVLVLTGLIAAVALIPTLSRSVRSVPRPRDWPHLAVAEAGSGEPVRV